MLRLVPRFTFFLLSSFLLIRRSIPRKRWEILENMVEPPMSPLCVANSFSTLILFGWWKRANSRCCLGAKYRVTVLARIDNLADELIVWSDNRSIFSRSVELPEEKVIVAVDDGSFTLNAENGKPFSMTNPATLIPYICIRSITTDIIIVTFTEVMLAKLFVVWCGFKFSLNFLLSVAFGRFKFWLNRR